jgi:ribosomal protein L37AE/L43A
MINLLPKCVKCGSNVSDSVEPDVEKVGQIKVGRYVKNVWMCEDCLNQTESFGTASSADVSPNTPKADEADI